MCIESKELQALSIRFSEIYKAFHENLGETIPSMAEKLGIKRSELESYFNGNADPSFDFLRFFCKTFGINYNFLNEGKEAPFLNRPTDTFYSPLDVLKCIEKNRPSTILFVRNSDFRAETFVVFQLDRYRYEISSERWAISGDVGNTGSHCIHKFYLLLAELKKKMLRVYGYSVDEELFLKIFNGEIFCDEISRKYGSYWVDDFTDINHLSPCSKNYKDMYGGSFVRAQEIVREIEELKK